MAGMQHPIWAMDLARPTAASRLRRSLLPGVDNPAEIISPGTARALLQAMALIAIFLFVSGAGRPAVALGDRGDPAAGHAVEILIGRAASGSDGPADLMAAVPADFGSVMGYRPVVIDINGIPALGKPTGACSSPVHLAFDMEPTCKGHDLGYDLLRYAAAIGAPLGEWARPLIDDWWYAQMHQRCELRHSGPVGLACHSQVLAIEAVVSTNSWREGLGPPIEENPWRYLGAAFLVPLLLIAPRRLLGRRSHHPVGRLQSAPEVTALGSR